MAYVSGTYKVYNSKGELRSPTQSPPPNQSMTSNVIPEQRSQSSQLAIGVVGGAVVGISKQVIDTQVNRTGNQRLQTKINQATQIVGAGVGASLAVKSLIGGTATTTTAVGIIAAVGYVAVKDWQYQIEQNELSKEIQHNQQLSGIRAKNFKVGGSYYD